MRYRIIIKLSKYDGEDELLNISGASEETRNLVLNNYSGAQYKTISFIEPEAVSSENGIEILDLSARSYNCLKRAYINSISDVIVCYNTGKLASVRNLGRKGFHEVEDKLLSLNLARRYEVYDTGSKTNKEENKIS